MRWLLLLLLGLPCCKPKSLTGGGNEAGKRFTPQFIPGPRALVYKTRKDYRKLVPVILSSDRSTIISYPHPTDLATGNGYSLPVSLKQGYLLDKRGIRPEVAFLKLTYEEYGALKELPDLQEMYGWIVDKDPLEVMCDCGAQSAFSDMEKQLIELIDQQKLLITCKKLK